MIWRPSWLRSILSATRAGERSGSATWPTTGCCWKDSRLDDGRKHRRRTPLSPTVRYKDCVYAWYPSMYVCSVQCVLIDKYIVRKFYFSCRCSDLKLIFLVPLDIWKIFLLLSNFFYKTFILALRIFHYCTDRRLGQVLGQGKPGIYCQNVSASTVYFEA